MSEMELPNDGTASADAVNTAVSNIFPGLGTHIGISDRGDEASDLNSLHLASLSTVQSGQHGIDICLVSCEDLPSARSSPSTVSKNLFDSLQQQLEGSLLGSNVVGIQPEDLGRPASSSQSPPHVSQQKQIINCPTSSVNPSNICTRQDSKQQFRYPFKDCPYAWSGTLPEVCPVSLAYHTHKSSKALLESPSDLMQEHSVAAEAMRFWQAKNTFLERSSSGSRAAGEYTPFTPGVLQSRADTAPLDLVSTVLPLGVMQCPVSMFVSSNTQLQPTTSSVHALGSQSWQQLDDTLQAPQRTEHAATQPPLHDMSERQSASWSLSGPAEAQSDLAKVPVCATQEAAGMRDTFNEVSALFEVVCKDQGGQGSL